MFRNPLNADALDDYVSQIKTILATNPADGAALITALDAAEIGAANIKDYRLKQILEAVKHQLSGMSSGGVSTITITTPGSGYVAGKSFVIAGDGESGVMTITSVDGTGAITGVEVAVPGAGYSSGSVDLSNDGDGLGVVSVVVDDNDIGVVNDALSGLAV